MACGFVSPCPKMARVGDIKRAFALRNLGMILDAWCRKGRLCAQSQIDPPLGLPELLAAFLDATPTARLHSIISIATRRT